METGVEIPMCCDKTMIKVGHMDSPGFYFPSKSTIALDLFLCEECQQIKFKYAPPRGQVYYVTIPEAKE